MIWQSRICGGVPADCIIVSITRKAGMLLVSVQNAKGIENIKGNGVAVKNLLDRLKWLYDG